MRIPRGSWSLQPVAIGAAVEVTKPSKPLMKRTALRRFSEHAGRNVSERRADLEKRNAEADLAEQQGRPLLLGNDERWAPSSSAGVMATACMHTET